MREFGVTGEQVEAPIGALLPVQLLLAAFYLIKCVGHFGLADYNHDIINEECKNDNDS